MPRPPEVPPNPLLGLLRRQPRPTEGELETPTMRAEWDGEHLAVTLRPDPGERSPSGDDAPATAPEALRLVSGEPIDVLLSRTDHVLGGDESVAELFGEDTLLGHQLHAEVRARGETLRLLAFAPADVVGDLPLRSSFGEPVAAGELVAFLRQLAAYGATIRVPVAADVEEPAPAGLDAMGMGNQREVAWLWPRAVAEDIDLDAYQRLEIVYGANGLWRPLVELYDRRPHTHGRVRLIAILERLTRLFDDGPELSHLWLHIGRECEAAERDDHARFAYFKAFQSWAQNVRAVEAKLELERRAGNLSEYRKMLGVRRKLILGYAGAAVAYLKLALELFEVGEVTKAEYLTRLAARLPATANRREVLDSLVDWLRTDPERARSALHRLTDEFFSDDEEDEGEPGDTEPSSGAPALRVVASEEAADEEETEEP